MDDEFYAKEACVKKIDYIRSRNLIVIHSFRRAEIYLMALSKAMRVQTIEFETDPDVTRGFAYNPSSLLFSFGKKVLGFEWSD